MLQYLRNNKGQPIGVMYAEKKGDSFVVGWSKCCDKEWFNKRIGIAIAKQRAGWERKPIIHVPYMLVDPLAKFYKRAAKYFKVPIPWVEITTNYKGNWGGIKLPVPPKVEAYAKSIESAHQYDTSESAAKAIEDAYTARRTHREKIKSVINYQLSVIENAINTIKTYNA